MVLLLGLLVVGAFFCSQVYNKFEKPNHGELQMQEGFRYKILRNGFRFLFANKE